MHLSPPDRAPPRARPGLVPATTALLLLALAALPARAEHVSAPTDGGLSTAVDGGPVLRSTVVGRGAGPSAPTAETERLGLGPGTSQQRTTWAGEAGGTDALIARAPGVVLRRTGTGPQLSTLSLRGATSDQLLVLLDGIPLSGAGSPTVDLGALPLSFLERITVVRGPAGAAFGQGALGGVVLLESRWPQGRRPRLDLEARTGSFGTGELKLAAQGALGAWQLLGAVDAQASAGLFPVVDPDRGPLLRQNADATRLGALLRGRRTLGDSADLDLLVQHTATERGLPGSLTSPSPGDRLATNRSALQATSRLRTGEAGPLTATELSLRLFTRHERTAATLASFPSPPANDLALGVEGSGRAQLAGSSLEARLRLAGELMRGPATVQRSELGLSLADATPLGPFTLLPALRVDRVGEALGLSPQLGATFTPIERLELRATLARSFRAPSFGELYVEQGFIAPNPLLVPETASAAELGARLRLGPVQLALSAFGQLYESLIVYELFPPFRLKPFNVGTAGMVGGEAEASVQLARPLLLTLGYAHLRTRNLHDDARFYDRELPYRPRHTGSARLAWSGSRLRSHLDLGVQGAQWINRANTTSLAPRALLAAGVAVRPVRTLPLWLGVEGTNLLDVRTSDLSGWPLPGRAGLLTLRLAEGADSP